MSESTVTEKNTEEGSESKNLAMLYLHINVDSDKDVGCLSRACYDKYPKGLAYLAWKNLHKNYVKTDIFSALKFRQELHILKLKDKFDPTDFFEKISTIQMQAKKINDDTVSNK